MSYASSAGELEARWGNREDGHPIFSRSIHRACLVNGRTLEVDYWKWASSRLGYTVWNPETGWT